jgi:hypothetical protein
MHRLLVLALCVVAALRAADTSPDPAVQAAMEKMSTLAPEHAALARAVGDWDVQATVWMAPGAAPLAFTDAASFSATLNGRWIRQDYRGERMGRPYAGVGLSGFDTVEKTFVSTWYDNVSTAAMTTTGTSSDGGRTITYTGEVTFCPMTGGPVSTRSVLSCGSPERMVFTMYNTPKGGTEMKAMELVYTRRRPATAKP